MNPENRMIPLVWNAQNRHIHRGRKYWWLLGPEDGEGNGKLLQYSCLENPMDGGAWWAAFHGVGRD